MELDFAKTAGVFALVIAIGTAALILANVMPSGVVLMMVVPSMVIFGLLMVLLGVAHGQYRATQRPR